MEAGEHKDASARMAFFLCHKNAQVVFVLILEILNFMFFTFQRKFS